MSQILGTWTAEQPVAETFGLLGTLLPFLVIRPGAVSPLECVHKLQHRLVAGCGVVGDRLFYHRPQDAARRNLGVYGPFAARELLQGLAEAVNVRDR